MQTILLVDDSTTILLSISSILGKAGYAVEKAANAEEALKKFQRRNQAQPADHRPQHARHERNRADP